MLQRIELKEQPHEDLVMEFIVHTTPEKADSALLRFTEYEMRTRLNEQRVKGFTGWNTPQCENSDLMKRLKKNLEAGDYIDVINLAAMLNAREKIFTEKHLTETAENR